MKAVGKTVFTSVAAIDKLAHHEDSNSRAQLCLLDTHRALNFLLRRDRLSEKHAHLVALITVDVMMQPSPTKAQLL